MTIDGDEFRERDLFPADEPAPALTEKARSWDRRWVEIRRGGDRIVEGFDPDTDPAQAITHRVNRWHVIANLPATTVGCDPRVSARCHHEQGEQGRSASASVRAGDYEEETPIRLELEEAAVLQGFAADYPWQGTRTKRFEQIGNAVPPPFALAILSALLGREAS